MVDQPWRARARYALWSVQDLRLAEAQVYVADSGSLVVLNSANPAQLTLAAQATLEPASALIQHQIVGDLIYVGDLNTGLYLVRRNPAVFSSHYAYLPGVQRR